MRVMITGATGFVGRNLATACVKRGIEVVGTGRSEDTGSELRQLGIDFQAADISQARELNRAVSSADYMIHCAAKTGDWGSTRDFFDINVVGTRNVIHACRQHHIKHIIFMSTPSVYFDGTDRLNIRESDPLPKRQRSTYAKTKLISETELLELVDEGFQVIIFRPRAVYGPHDNTFLPRVMRMSKRPSFPLINGGKALVDITYIDNLVDAVFSCLDAPANAWQQIYNISNNDPITMRDWFAQLLNVMNRPFSPKDIPESAAKAMAGMMELIKALPFANKKPSMTRFSVGYMAKSMTLSVDKAKDMLHYQPEIGNEESFKRLADWFQSQS